MGSGDVDTDKFASWPLLRPDELATIPSDVLQASLAALDLLCGQSSDEDAIADYAQRQRDRTTAILLERAAQVRVRALLAASTSPSLSMAPSHGIPSTDRDSGLDRCSLAEHKEDLTSGATADFSDGSKGGSIPFVRSPRRARVGHQHTSHKERPIPRTPIATTPETSSLLSDTAQVSETEDKLDAASHVGDDRTRDPDNSTPQSCAPENSIGSFCDLDWPGGRVVDATDAANVGGMSVKCQDMYTSRQHRGQPSFTNAMHEKWGSVFVVGGGQRRRRAPGRRKSVEAEDTPATRRAHVDKERQERRKASLCRLLARKEQRALQQETRRKRRAAAARATAATSTTVAAAVAAAAAAAAAAGTAETPTAAAAGEAGVTSVTTTITTTTKTPTPSRTSNTTTPLPGYRRARSPTNTVKTHESNIKTDGSAHTPVPVPASSPSQACLADANAPERTLGTIEGNAAESTPFKQVTVRDTVGELSREEVDQPWGNVRQDTVVRGVAEICGVPVCKSSGKEILDTTAVGSSSESESVSGGDSSDGDDLSVDEGGAETTIRAVQVRQNQPFENTFEEGKFHLGADGAGSDANDIAHDQSPALVEGCGHLSPPRQAEKTQGEFVTRIDPPRSTNGMHNFAPVILPGTVEDCQEEGSVEPIQAKAIRDDVGPRLVDTVCDDDVPQQMAVTTAVPPMSDTAITPADGSEETTGSDMGSGMESDNDRGSAGSHSDSGALGIPGPLDVEAPKAGSADGCVERGQSRFMSPVAATPTPIGCDHDTQHQPQHLTAAHEALATSVKPSLDEVISRWPSCTQNGKNPPGGQRITEPESPIGPHPKEATTEDRGDRPKGATLQHSACGPGIAHVRHRQNPLSSTLTNGGATALDDVRSDEYGGLGGYTECFPKIGAILSAYHNGRALTREADCRSLPLTSSILSRGRGGRGGVTGLTATEEEACMNLQLKLYAIYLRVIKDYAAVFSLGDDWPTRGAEDPSSLVYSGDPSALHYRVNSKARPEVYNIVTDVLNNRCEQWEELPTGLGLKTTWNLLWTWSKPHIQYSSLLVWQKVNHFPNSRELTRKDLLNKHISRFMAPGGRLAKEFHIMPQTFVLPHEFTTFVAAFTSSGHGGRDRRKPGGDKAPEYVGFDGFDDTRGEEGATGKAEAMCGVSRKDNVWIMKPVGMSRGRGIRLIDDIKNITYADKVVLQRYIGNPLLLDGYKFDLRLYVLVTSFNPLEAFMYKEGFARVSTHLYEKGDIGNPFIHLTNSRLAASGVDVEALWAGICSLVVKSLVCVEGAILNQPNSFELFGYDVLIDDKLRPWLIEVNASPSMVRDSHIDRQVKETLIFDTIHLVDPLPFDRQNLADVMERRLSAVDNSKAWSSKERRASESSDQRNASAPLFEGDKSKETGARASVYGLRPRRRKDEVELDKDLNDILGGRRPRIVGELPNRMGNFVRLCPATAAHRHARRLRKRIIRPRPGEDNFDTYQ